ncbi:MAG TPA: peptidyl-prolyl cis-trans isomerase [Candidatus Angelobacter sp.]
MLRIVLTCMLASACALAQSAPAQAPSISPVPPANQPVFHPENVGPNTVVVEIQGACSGLGDGVIKQAPCVTQITKSQFVTMIASLGTSNPMSTTAAQRNFAESYIQLLALANAAESAGADKDPQFLELMKIVRLRTLSDFYRRSLENKASNPSPEEIQAYYKEHPTKYEQIRLERVIVPPARVHATSAADAGKKARDLAELVRARAVNGEDMDVLQAYAYKELGLPAPPPADMGLRRRGTLAASLESELFALKPGEVTKVEVEPAGFTVYRLRTRDLPSIESIKNELLRDMKQKYVSDAIKAAEDRVHSNLNLDYFTPHQAVVGPVPTHPLHSAPVLPPGITAAPVASPTPAVAPKQ